MLTRVFYFPHFCPRCLSEHPAHHQDIRDPTVPLVGEAVILGSGVGRGGRVGDGGAQSYQHQPAGDSEITPRHPTHIHPVVLVGRFRRAPMGGQHKQLCLCLRDKSLRVSWGGGGGEGF